MGIAAYIVVNLTMYFAHLCLAWRWYKPKGRSFTTALLAAWIACLAQIILSTIILGEFLHDLTTLTLFWSNMVIALLILILVRMRGPIMLKVFIGLRESLVSAYRAIASDVVLIFLCLISFVVFAWLTYLAVLLPPYSWDALTYHMGHIGYWIQDARIGNHQMTPHWVMNNFPINIEYIYHWNTVFFRHDLIANGTQLFAVPFGVLAIFTLARNTGRRRSSSLLAAVLFTGVPIVIQQSTTCYIDLISSSIFLASLAFFLKPRFTFADIVYGSLAMGIFLGSKGSAPRFIIGAVVPMIIYHIPHFWKNVGFLRLIGWILMALFLFMLVGSKKYITNYIEHKNPVHPYKVEIGGKVIFEGWMDVKIHVSQNLLGSQFEEMEKRSPLGQVYYSWSEPLEVITYDSRLGGFGPLMFIVLLPCIGAAVLIAILRRDGRMLFTLLVILAAFWTTPVGRFWIRYNIFVIAGFLVSLAYMIDLFRYSRFNPLLKILVLLLFIQGVFIGSRGDVVTPGQVQYYKEAPFEKINSAAFALEGLDLSLARTVREMSVPGTTIAFDYGLKHSFIYPLWNNDFSNKVLFLYYPETDEWLEQIKKWDVDFVILGKEYETFERMEGLKDEFTLIQEGRYNAFFKVNKDAFSEI